MSLIKKSDVKSHLSTRSKGLLPFRPRREQPTSTPLVNVQSPNVDVSNITSAPIHSISALPVANGPLCNPARSIVSADAIESGH